MVKDSRRVPPPKVAEAPQVRKDCSSAAPSCVSSLDGTSSSKESGLSQEPSKVEQSGYYYPASGYYAYYYPTTPGYGSSFVDWAGANYVIGVDGTGIQHPISPSDAVPVAYYMPELQPGYDPCCAMGIGVTQGVDEKLLADQTSAMNAMVPQSLASPYYYPTVVSCGPGYMHAYPLDGFGGCQFDGKVPTEPSKLMVSTKSHAPNHTTPKSSAHARNEMWPLLERPKNVHRVPLKQVNKVPPSNCQEKPARLPTDETTAHNFVNPEKPRLQHEAKRLADYGSLRGHNADPGMKNTKLSWVLRTDQAGAPLAKDADKANHDVTKRDNYNLPDFPTAYDNAMFFVIKSYSEDDVHKSIKYGVWSSTTSGNRKLDHAFLVAQQKTRDTGKPFPVFLLFSVNTSGQFCGVAEMIGRVDFSRNMDFWQQDKWNGYFPVKWHIIKDVPNPQFRHILLENNENKPVTYSRDTQEVFLPRGSEMLKTFKNYSSKTSILDDFVFYEDRQRIMQARRTKRPIPLQLFMPRMEGVAEVSKDNLKPVIYGLESLHLGSTIKN